MDQLTRETMFSSASTEYQTPDEIFNPVQRRLRLTHDVAASHENHRLPSYSTPEGTFVKNFTTPYRKTEATGLDASAWEGRRVWCNPPYGRGIDAWVKAAALYHPEVAAMLLPARTETEWFQRWVAPYAEVHFLMGRVRFWGHYDSCYLVKDPQWADMGYADDEWPMLRLDQPEHDVHRLTAAPFPSIVAVYQPGVWVPRGRVSGWTWDPRSDEDWEGGLRDV